MQSFTEENYLKAIYHLSEKPEQYVQTNAIAERMQTKAASVTDMMKKLSEKNLIEYVRYTGAKLTPLGYRTAVGIVRKHRLWEVFLVETLDFKWDEVHDVAEELEHINSELLIERLDAFLGFPKTDPHGDPIPDKNGKFEKQTFVKLNKLETGAKGTVTGVSEHSTPFLRHLEKVGLTLGTTVEVTDVSDFDGSIEIRCNGNKTSVSREVAKHILINT